MGEKETESETETEVFVATFAQNWWCRVLNTVNGCGFGGGLVFLFLNFWFVRLRVAPVYRGGGEGGVVFGLRGCGCNFGKRSEVEEDGFSGGGGQQ